ncbi:hypothetical protein GCM10027214_11890 [Stenotrophomonas tumulicola]
MRAQVPQGGAIVGQQQVGTRGDGTQRGRQRTFRNVIGLHGCGRRGLGQRWDGRRQGNRAGAEGQQKAASQERIAGGDVADAAMG